VGENLLGVDGQHVFRVDQDGNVWHGCLNSLSVIRFGSENRSIIPNLPRNYQ
jgi:hypothetical protein